MKSLGWDSGLRRALVGGRVLEGIPGLSRWCSHLTLFRRSKERCEFGQTNREKVPETQPFLGFCTPILAIKETCRTQKNAPS